MAIGNRFGIWTIIDEPNIRMYRTHIGVICRCDCGTERLVSTYCLKYGNSKSCGCVSLINSAKKNRTHGQSQHRIHGIWRSMKERCQNPNHHGYHRYGGRGIKVCKRWQKFENFLADNEAIFNEGLTLDRRNNDGHYSPRNCQWVTKKDQSNNRHNNLFLEFNGERLTCAQWAVKVGVKEITLRKRIQAGWPPERCLMQKIRPYHQSRPFQ